MDQDMQILCPDDALTQLVALAGEDEPAALSRIAALIDEHPADPRLHFLGGSLLAAQQRFAEARSAMERSIEIAPGFAIARFQLGLLELSSGDSEAADATLRPLAELESDDALVLFARGLRHLARDNLAVAADLLKQGIACNGEHPLVSRDMELIVAGIEEQAKGPGDPGEHMSAVEMLLRQHSTRH